MPLVASFDTPDLNKNMGDETNNNIGYGETFIGASGTLDKAKFSVMKVGTPTGNAVAKLYEDEGIYGVNSAPGTLLATSDVVDVSTFSDSANALVDFTFSGAEKIVLTDLAQYFISIEYSNGDISNYVQVMSGLGYEATSAYYNTAWIAEGTFDIVFYVYNDDTSFITNINGLARASVKEVNGLAIASIKNINGLA